jgi:NhaA family Na+:H+ antiporter
MCAAPIRRLALPVSERDHVRGPRDAGVTIVEYGDYECPYCGRAESQLQEIQDRAINQVRVVYRHFPNRVVHPHARRAAEAAEAASAQGKFWEMHDLLFDNQDRLEATWFLNDIRYDGAWDAESLLEAIRKPLGVRISEIGQEFTRMAASGGLMILIFSLLALFWANSDMAEGYAQLWDMDLGFRLGGFGLSKHLGKWVNDGLMAVFFFVVGLEIKREVTAGKLNTPKKAALPLAAALGGMAMPALIFVAINAGEPATLPGWGIPVATDIAFALGVPTVLQGRIPLSLKVFFTAMAIADDLGAILVLALFYSSDISVASLGAAAVIFLILILLNRWRVFSPIPYAVLGVVLWLAFLQSGVHPTIAGVLLAMAIPTRGPADVPLLLAQTDTVLNRYDYDEDDDESHEQALAHTLKTILDRIEPPAQRLEHGLQPWTTYLILPTFALANAGILIGGSPADMLQPVSLGIILGLALGKPVGVSLFTWLATRLGLAELPPDVSWPQFISASALAGIGFTVSLFIAGAGFDDPALLASAKLGILVGSVIAGVVGYTALSLTSPRYDMSTSSSRRATSPA